MNGEIEVNEPVRVYNTSGPWGNPDFHVDVTRGFRRSAQNGFANAATLKKSMDEKFKAD